MNIDWYGNYGRANPAPGKFKKIRCGLCGKNMKVTRNVLGSTSMAETIARKRHRYDAFHCPNIEEIWHRKIDKLKMDVYLAEIEDDPFFEDKKRAVEKEVIQLLKNHAAQ